MDDALAYIIKRVVSMLLRVRKDRLREMLLESLEEARISADKTPGGVDDVISVCALAIVKDDTAWSEIIDLLQAVVDS